MDYCHNVAGLESMADFVGRLGAPRSIGMISMPGDRKDSDIKTFGELAARTFNELVIREDTNRRGRKDGEIAELLRQSALGVGMADDNIHIQLEEMDAARTAIDRAERDDLVVLLVDKPAMIWQELEKRASLRGQLL
jgi:cyanophycin synthetase